MDYTGTMMDAEDCYSEEEEDWTDTHWDSVPAGDSSVQLPSGSSDAEAKGDRPEGVNQNASLMTRMQLNDHKAGMQGLDKEHINQIIYEASKGSRFFENERRKEEQVQHRIQQQEKHRRSITEPQLQRGRIEADDLIAELSSSRDLSQTIVHVDMDAFYAAVHMRDDPSLRSKPMAVGGIGMLSTSNYEARKYGVRAAMPGFIGKKLCPQLVIVRQDFAKYREVSQQVREIFAVYDANFCPMSLDEAYLNFTEHLEKRATIPETQRSFIKRCQTPADPVLCCCDLNKTVREQVMKSLDLKYCNELDSSSISSDRSLNGNYKEDENRRNMTEKFTEETECLQTAVTPKLEADSSSNITAVVQKSQCQSEQAKVLDSMSALIGTQCPSCARSIPQFEMVTFGVDIESAVQEMRCRIEQRTCLTASAGIAPNMMLSKVCSDQNKPNGQFFLPAIVEDVTQFVKTLPIRKISGIGRVTEQLLGALGICTCSDLFEKRALLYHLYSSVSFSYFMRVALGIGSTQVARAREEDRKSMSTEQTFGELSRPEELYAKCLELCHALAEDLANEQLVGKTMSLKLKTTDFQVRTRAQTMSSYTNNAEVMFTVAKGILRAEVLAESPKPLRLRLMGVRMSKLNAESNCPQEKQDTIMDFFRKAPGSSKQLSPTKPHMQDNQECFSPKIQSSSETKDQYGSALAFDRSSALAEKSEEDSVGEESASESHKQKSHSSSSSATPSQDEVNKQDRPDSASAKALLRVACSNQTVADEGESHDENAIDQCRLDSQVTENCLGSGSVESIENAYVANACSRSSTESTNRTEGVQALASKQNALDVSRFQPSLDQALDDGISNISSQAVDHSIGFMRESAFTCPVCNKAIACINLTDFNAHIDMCLQPETQNSSQAVSRSQPSPRGQLKSASNVSPSSSKMLMQENQTSLKSRKKASFERKISASENKFTKDSITISSASQQEPYGSKKEKMACSTVTSQQSKPSSATAKPCSTGRGHSDEGCKETVTPSTFQRVAAELDSADFLVCPLCGAERADWTLEVFNQHVDTCLNRSTISQILEEQRSSGDQPRKRSAGRSQEEHRSTQQGKKAKKTPTIEPERTILSFFKT